MTGILIVAGNSTPSQYVVILQIESTLSISTTRRNHLTQSRKAILTLGVLAALRETIAFLMLPRR